MLVTISAAQTTALAEPLALRSLGGEKGPGSIKSARINEAVQQTRPPDAKLRPALRAWPQFGAGCG